LNVVTLYIYFTVTLNLRYDSVSQDTVIQDTVIQNTIIQSYRAFWL